MLSKIISFENKKSTIIIDLNIFFRPMISFNFLGINNKNLIGKLCSIIVRKRCIYEGYIEENKNLCGENNFMPFSSVKYVEIHIEDVDIQFIEDNIVELFYIISENQPLLNNYVKILWTDTYKYNKYIDLICSNGICSFSN